MTKKTSGVLILMIIFTIFLLVLTIGFFLLYRHFQYKWIYSLSITFLTIFYHFAMRMAVGESVTVIFKKREFPQDKLGFKIHPFEKKLYKKLKVKKWKNFVLTAKPEQFDLNAVSPKELLHNVMQAELVHRIIIVLSFVPVLFCIPFGVPLVFILTSIFASLLDLIFVIIQRYNRPRVLCYCSRTERDLTKSFPASLK